MHVVKFDTEPQVLLNDVFDGDLGSHNDSSRLLILDDKRLRFAFNLLSGEIRYLDHHAVILVCIVKWVPLRPHSPFAFFTWLTSREISPADQPLVVRRSAARSTGVRLMISEMSDDTRPALASRSSASHCRIRAISFTFSSTGGANSSRSTLDMEVGLTAIICAFLRKPSACSSRRRRTKLPKVSLPLAISSSRCAPFT